MGDENRAKKSVPSSSSAAADCDVVLGLKMQRTESLPSKRTMAMHHPYLSPPSPSPSPSSLICSFGSAAYGINATAPPLPPHLLLPPSAKMPFTVTQWQELERQKMIYKYMTSSIPVPTELLLSPIIPTVTTSSDLPSSQIQSNTSGLELKFSRSSDPEPWRCRRTDGKKWRCSRDVTPDQKYCERHAHKNRPRSRKPVESHTHNFNTNSSNSNSNSVSRSSGGGGGGSLSNTLPANVASPSPHPPSPNPIFQFPSSAFEQTQKRSMTDWLSSYGQQWQQFHEEGEVDEDDNNDDERRLRDVSQNWLSNDHDHDHDHDHDQYLSYISPDISGNSNQMMTTRHFIDAWPSSSTEKDQEMLVLNGEDNDNVNSQLGIGILTQSPWMPSHEQQQPGGPLGEALCSNNKNSAATTSGGKSSGEDDGLGFQF